MRRAQSGAPGLWQLWTVKRSRRLPIAREEVDAPAEEAPEGSTASLSLADRVGSRLAWIETREPGFQGARA